MKQERGNVRALPAPRRFPRSACRALALTMALLSACHRGRTAFDGTAAMGYVRQQLAFGPRIPGSVGHRRTGDWIIQQMRTRADTVVVQQWTHVTAAGD